MHEPIIIATLFAGEEDPAHQIYCQAYGIEMQVDYEWNTDIILLAHPDYFKNVTEQTDVTGDDVKIVSAGITHLPQDSDGNACWDAPKNEKNNWLLIGHDAIFRGGESIETQIQYATKRGCRILLCVDAVDRDSTLSRVAMCGDVDYSDLIIVLQHADTASPESLATLLGSIRTKLGSAKSEIRFAVEMPEKASSEWTPSEDICGLFMVGTSHDIFCSVLEVANRVGTGAG